MEKQTRMNIWFVSNPKFNDPDRLF